MPPHFDDAALARLKAILASRPAIEIDAPDCRRAAVLAGFIRTESGWSLIYSRRAENLAVHSGQIAFPGGAVEEGETLEQAVRREAEEEVGLPPHVAEIIGRLDDVVTNSGYLVAPFAAVIHEPVDYVLQQSEVVEAFEVPVDALLSSRNPEVRYVTFRGRSHPAYFYHYGSYEIWGLTGRMTKALLDLVWQAL